MNSEFAGEIRVRVADAKALFENPESFPVEKISRLAEELIKIFRNGRNVFFLGNGGSAAEAMHLAAEFTGRCVVNHVPLPAVCLNESQSAITAIGNDFGVEEIFARQVMAHVRAGDILICLSTSGKSKNVLRALEVAKTQGAECYLWMGDFEIPIKDVDTWKVPSKSTPRIQEIHLVWGHVLAEIVEERFA
jgi:D-sedoheptulose 7-phosphate isomerase